MGPKVQLGLLFLKTLLGFQGEQQGPGLLFRKCPGQSLCAPCWRRRGKTQECCVSVRMRASPNPAQTQETLTSA